MKEATNRPAAASVLLFSPRGSERDVVFFFFFTPRKERVGSVEIELASGRAGL